MMDIRDNLASYLQELHQRCSIGDATEASYYSALESLLRAYDPDLHITTQPRLLDAGIPDFVIRRRRSGKVVGYIEAKDLGRSLEQLGKQEQEQKKRYLGLPNVLYTNFLDFELYRDGRRVTATRIAEITVLRDLRAIPPIHDLRAFEELLDAFLVWQAPEIRSAQQLAKALALRAKLLREPIIAELANTEPAQVVDQVYAAYRQYLMPTLTPEQFADIYAQTLAYGLFTARLLAPEGDFSLGAANQSIPRNIRVLRETFRMITDEIPPSMVFVHDIVTVLAATDVSQIRSDLRQQTGGDDPLIHFYQTFLATYDPAKRKALGVYYTPKPVVDFIVKSVGSLLREHFGKTEGFAAADVTLLDPAAGTLTFPAAAIRLARRESDERYGEAAFNKRAILNNFYAFEIEMASYVIGHLRAALVFEEIDRPLEEGERFKLYLTNTLEMASVETGLIPFAAGLSEEAQAAQEVKERVPILAIIGNPPYSGISQNPSEVVLEVPTGSSYKDAKGRMRVAKRARRIKQKTFIGQLIEDYKVVDGQPLGERKHWLQDDYVKFIRWAQWKIEQNPAGGVIGFITNHGYLDNPTFRGMRQSLLNTFSDIYVLNLHGSALNKETTLEGGKDVNVFDIRPGTAIVFLVRDPEKQTPGRMLYAERYGLREEKFSWLSSHDIGSTEWKELNPASPMYWFVSRASGGEEYERFWPIPVIFPVNSTGIVTGRDKFVIDFDKMALSARIRDFRDPNQSDDWIKQAYGLRDKPAYRWFVAAARRQLHDEAEYEKYFTRILYRPFDDRWAYYHPAVIFWPRVEIMRHMQRPNLGLVTRRQMLPNRPDYVFIADKMISDGVIRSDNKGGESLFPLYLYEGNATQQTTEGAPEGVRQPNITAELLAKLREAYGRDAAPEEIFSYTYAVLYAPTYRRHYEESLRSDFPRVPFSADAAVFEELATLGQKLIALHLLRAPELDAPAARFRGEGDAMVHAVTYDEASGRVCINGTQCFEGVPLKVWQYRIGGYQVAEKWLKDRRGRTLSGDDIRHYLRITEALRRTLLLQSDIDTVYAAIGDRIVPYT